jgi:hypothetical protein
MKTEKEGTKEFFEMLGEIWRDITAIEFLMRGALAQKTGDVSKFPTPPYTKGKIYVEYPEAFSHKYFNDVAQDFNKKFPLLAIPQELIDLRNAMAHGSILQINSSGTEELIKFRKQNNGTLMIEFSLLLEPNRLAQIRQSLMELRRYIAKEATDFQK